MQSRAFHSLVVKNLTQLKEELKAISNAETARISVQISNDWRFQSKDKSAEVAELAYILNSYPIHTLKISAGALSSKENLEELLTSLADNKTIKNLDLQKCFLAYNANAMVKLLGGSIPLNELNFSENALPEGMLDAAANKGIQVLLLNDSHTASNKADQKFDILRMDENFVKSLRNNSNLTLLSLTDNVISKKILTDLMNIPSLRMLHLPANSFPEDFYKAENLIKAGNLINFSYNQDYKSIGLAGFLQLIENSKNFQKEFVDNSKNISNFIRKVFLLANLWEATNPEKVKSINITTLPLELVQEIANSMKIEEMDENEKKELIRFVFEHRKEKFGLEKHFLEIKESLPIFTANNFNLEIAGLLKNLEDVGVDKAQSIAYDTWRALLGNKPYATEDNLHQATNLNRAVQNIIRCANYLQEYIQAYKNSLITPGIFNPMLIQQVHDINDFLANWTKITLPQVLKNYLNSVSKYTSYRFDFDEYKNTLNALSELAGKNMNIILLGKENFAIKAYDATIKDMINSEKENYDANKNLNLIKLNTTTLPHIEDYQQKPSSESAITTPKLRQ